MSAFDDFQRNVRESDADKATETLGSLWKQGVDTGQLTSCLVEPASASLQLRFDTPHAVICLDAVLQLLELTPPKDHLFFLQGFVRYLSSLPKLSLDFKETERIGTLGVKHAKKGYARSLMEHKINNAFYYALWFIEEEGLDRFLHQCLEIASHEVDFLGHVFIYAHALCRLCRRIESNQVRPLVFQLTEFLARKAKVEFDTHQKEGREVDCLIPLALERINILGHNAIFAHKISQAVDHLEGRYVEHLCSQLVRNIESSPDRFSKDDLEEMVGGLSDRTNDPLGALRRGLTRGNERESIYYCRLYLEDQGLTAELISTLTKCLSAKDPLQPHYVIFPQAVFDLAQVVDQPCVELALARVIRMICGAD